MKTDDYGIAGQSGSIYSALCPDAAPRVPEKLWDLSASTSPAIHPALPSFSRSDATAQGVQFASMMATMKRYENGIGVNHLLPSPDALATRSTRHSQFHVLLFDIWDIAFTRQAVPAFAA